MTGQRIGYVRVSTLDQNEKRQLESQVLDRVFTDKASGRDTARPQLTELLRFVRDGDTVVVHSMDRLARNLDDLRALVQGLTRRGVGVEFVKEQLVFTGEDSPMANLMLSVMGAFAEFERSLIRERQREGIALAQQRGAYKGRKKTLSPERAAELVQRAGSGRRAGGPRIAACRPPETRRRDLGPVLHLCGNIQAKHRALPRWHSGRARGGSLSRPRVEVTATEDIAEASHASRL